MCEPELSSIDNKPEKMCRDTVKRMIKVLENEDPVENKKVVISCEFVERGTTDIGG